MLHLATIRLRLTFHIALLTLGFVGKDRQWRGSPFQKFFVYLDISEKQSLVRTIDCYFEERILQSLLITVLHLNWLVDGN